MKRAHYEHIQNAIQRLFSEWRTAPFMTSDGHKTTGVLLNILKGYKSHKQTNDINGYLKAVIGWDVTGQGSGNKAWNRVYDAGVCLCGFNGSEYSDCVCARPTRRPPKFDNVHTWCGYKVFVRHAPERNRTRPFRFTVISPLGKWLVTDRAYISKVGGFQEALYLCRAEEHFLITGEIKARHTFLALSTD